MSIDIKNLTIKTAHDHLKNGDFTVRELVDAYLETINSKNKDIYAYIELFSDIDDAVLRAQ